MRDEYNDMADAEDVAAEAWHYPAEASHVPETGPNMTLNSTV